MNEELRFCGNSNKNRGGAEGGVEGGCERRIEVFVKIHFFSGWGGRLGGIRLDVNEELKFL